MRLDSWARWKFSEGRSDMFGGMLRSGEELLARSGGTDVLLGSARLLDLRDLLWLWLRFWGGRMIKDEVIISFIVRVLNTSSLVSGV